MNSGTLRFLPRRALAALGLSTALTAAALTAGGGAFIASAQAAPVYVQNVQVPSFAPLVEAVRPTVVSVQVKSTKSDDDDDIAGNFGGFFDMPGFDQLPDDHPLKRFFRDFQDQRNFRYRGGKGQNQPARPRLAAEGSGFFYTSDGYVVTNNHVVNSGNLYSVVLNDGTELPARLIGRDSRTDLAVLKIDAKNRKFPYVSFADDSQVHIGDWVAAVGNPFGLGGTVTAGIVSARGRDIGAGVYDDFIQIDAAVNRGNSGGPSFNENGQVVGINTAIYSPSGGSVGIAFAIPASTAKQVVDQLIAKGAVRRGWLGVQIQPVTKEIAESVGLTEAKGALIADPMTGPGQKAGIKAGDIILAVNGAEVKDARDLARKVAAAGPDETVKLAVWRDGRQQMMSVKLGAMPSEKGRDSAGSADSGAKTGAVENYRMTVAPADDGNGVMITDLDSNSEAAERGLRPGDIIRNVDNQPVKNVRDLQAALIAAAKKGRSAVLLRVESQGASHFVALSVPKQKK